ncbi:MAG: SDR family NAD(P)-dependent oxidoreductase, partial [Pseudomonadota bacterium]|nr:SDR family NAD(P)-dependent oxidoreductase [Pseudomonadota bacterium]
MTPYQHLDRSVAGKTVFITGAASGMGRATAHLFAREGAKVMATDMNADGVNAVADEIRAAGHEAVATFPLDVGDHDAIKAAVAATVE